MHYIVNFLMYTISYNLWYYTPRLLFHPYKCTRYSLSLYFLIRWSRQNFRGPSYFWNRARSKKFLWKSYAFSWPEIPSLPALPKLRLCPARFFAIGVLRRQRGARDNRQTNEKSFFMRENSADTRRERKPRRRVSTRRYFWAAGWGATSIATTRI